MGVLRSRLTNEAAMPEFKTSLASLPRIFSPTDS
jgi:hypothetical protein